MRERAKYLCNVFGTIDMLLIAQRMVL